MFCDEKYLRDDSIRREHWNTQRDIHKISFDFRTAFKFKSLNLPNTDIGRTTVKIGKMFKWHFTYILFINKDKTAIFIMHRESPK